MDGMRVPEKKEFYVSQQTKDALITIVKMSKTCPQNVLVKGMQGCGKTELGEQLAARLNRVCPPPFQIGLLSESGQLFGQQTLHNNNVEYQQFLFTDAIQIPNAIIILDEFNRAQNPKALNDLYSVLGESRGVWLDEVHQYIKVAPGVIFFATLNEGAEFSGTDVVDAALADRFPYIIEMDTLPEDIETKLLTARTGLDEEQSERLVNIYASIRRTDIKLSTRRGLAIAELIKHGLDLRQAFILTLNINKDELERVLVSVHLGTEEETHREEMEWTTL